MNLKHIDLDRAIMQIKEIRLNFCEYCSPDFFFATLTIQKELRELKK